VVKSKKPPKVIGWREWVQLPDMSDALIRAKVDTGAQTSALHAFRLRVIENGEGAYATFELHPKLRSRNSAIKVKAKVVGFRNIRSSNGKTERRPVIITPVRIGDATHPIEITLTRRDEMGFRMLLGRSALRQRYVVDPSKSYTAPKPTNGNST
jgi:hypothetical protein